MKTKKAEFGSDKAIKRLAVRIKRVGAGRPAKGRRIPQGLQAAAIKLWRTTTLSAHEMSVGLGITDASLKRWASKEPVEQKKSQRRERVAQRGKAKFREVRINESCEEKSIRAFSLELRSGARVTGLGMAEIAQLLATDVGAR